MSGLHQPKTERLGSPAQREPHALGLVPGWGCGSGGDHLLACQRACEQLMLPAFVLRLIEDG